MISTTVFTLLFLHYVNAQNGAWVPEPLPAITPPDVVNLLIQDAADGAGDFVASVVGADATAATYLINCNPNTTRECGFDSWTAPIIITQGHSTMDWYYSEGGSPSGVLSAAAYSQSEHCTFDGTTASTAICTNSFVDDQPYTTTDPFQTRTYDGRLGHYSGESYSFVDYENSLWGPPPFIPVKITAGLESLSVFRAAAAATTTTSSGGSQSTGSGSPTKSIAGATITSAPKLASSTSGLSGAAGTGSAGGALSSTTSKSEAGGTWRRSVWVSYVVVGLIICVTL